MQELVPDAHDLDLRHLSIPVCGHVLKREAEITGLAWVQRSAIDGAIVDVRHVGQQDGNRQRISSCAISPKEFLKMTSTLAPVTLRSLPLVIFPSMYVTEPPAKFCAVAMCSRKPEAFARLGSAGLEVAGFPLRVSNTTSAHHTRSPAPTPRQSPSEPGFCALPACCRGENGCSCSESPMAGFYLYFRVACRIGFR